MHYTARSVVYGRDFMNTVLDVLKNISATALITLGKLRLSKLSTYQPTADSTIAGLAADEADFSGYPAGGLAFVVGVPVILAPNLLAVQTPTTFTAATAVPFVPNTVYGWWLDDGANVVAAEAFPSPVVAEFDAVGKYLQLDVVLPFMLSLSTTL